MAGSRGNFAQGRGLPSVGPKSSRQLEPGSLNSMGVVSKLRAGSFRLTILLVLLACAVLLSGCGGSSTGERGGGQGGEG